MLGALIAVLGLGLPGCGREGSQALGNLVSAYQTLVLPPLRPILTDAYQQPLPMPRRDRFVPGWQHLHEYSNQSGNTCGQAAGAMMLSHTGLNPLALPADVQDPVDGKRYARNAAFIAGLTERDPPDLALGLAGTSPNRLKGMLERHGMEAHISGGDTVRDFRGMRRWVQAGWPVAALVDAGALWGKTLVLHYVVVYRITTCGWATPWMASARSG